MSHTNSDEFRKAYLELEDGLTTNEWQFIRDLLIDGPEVHGRDLVHLVADFNEMWHSDEPASWLTIGKAVGIRDNLLIVSTYEYGGRDRLTEYCRRLSLCPIHFVDWAICFDDQPADCSQVRAIYPTSHDT